MKSCINCRNMNRTSTGDWCEKMKAKLDWNLKAEYCSQWEKPEITINDKNNCKLCKYSEIKVHPDELCGDGLFTCKMFRVCEIDIEAMDCMACEMFESRI